MNGTKAAARWNQLGHRAVVGMALLLVALSLLSTLVRSLAAPVPAATPARGADTPSPNVHPLPTGDREPIC